MRKGSIIGGLILIAAGIFFLILPLFPNVVDIFNIERQWPLIIVGVGVLFLLGAFFSAPGLAVPGSVIGGIGLLMYYQNLTSNWASWAYAWALIPVFVGVGTLIMYVLMGEPRRGIREGGALMVIGALLFLAFGTFFAGWLDFGVLLAIILIAIGLRLLVRTVLRGSDAEKA
jgi:hypothetical protein